MFVSYSPDPVRLYGVEFHCCVFTLFLCGNIGHMQLTGGTAAGQGLKLHRSNLFISKRVCLPTL